MSNGTIEYGFFYAPLLTLLDQALKSTFSSYTTNTDFGPQADGKPGVYISVEYPVDRTNYPSVWVDFEPEGNLETGGINRYELSPQEIIDPVAANDPSRWQVWTYRGYATYTVGSFSSLERARLVDELVRIMAFGSENSDTATFRQTIEDNEWIACNFNFDSITLRQKGESMRTDWESPQMIYEITMAMACFGEFISDKHTGQLANLRAFKLFPWARNEAWQPVDPDPGPFPPDGENRWY